MCIALIGTHAYAQTASGNNESIMKKGLLDHLNCVSARDKTAGDCSICDALYLGVIALRYLFGFLGLVAMVMFTVSGFQMITAFGDSGKYQAGMQGITAAIIGLVIILLSWQIIHFITVAMTGRSSGTLFGTGDTAQKWYDYCEDSKQINPSK